MARTFVITLENCGAVLSETRLRTAKREPGYEIMQAVLEMLGDIPSLSGGDCIKITEL